MDRPDGHQHDDGEDGGGCACEGPRHEQEPAKELGEADEEGEHEGGIQPELGEEGRRPREAAAASEAEQLLRPVSSEHGAYRDSEHGRTE
jgi:hypothetical protein